MTLKQVLSQIMPSRVAKWARTSFASLALLIGSSACGAAKPVPSALAQLSVEGSPPNARIYVDDRFVGTERSLALQGLSLAPGVHFIRVEAPGHFPHDLRLQAKKGKMSLRFQLQEIPP